MNKNAREFAQIYGENQKTVCSWIKKGYFGNVCKGKNGTYEIPEEMPLPYKTNGKIERDNGLLKALIDASDLGRSIHKNMFPKVDQYRFDRMLKFAEEKHLVEKREPYEGVIQLVSTEEGRAILNETPQVQTKIFEKICKGIEVGVVLAEFGINHGPQIMDAVRIMLEHI